jgi:DNA repair protein RecO (recombination protein O)
MILKTKGIVLRNVKYSETSIIMDVYTEAKGLRGYIVSGVRVPKSKISAGLLQVMSLIDLVCYDSGDSNKLNRIKEMKAAHIYTSLPFDVKKSSIGLFMAEVTRRSIRETEENPALFNFLYTVFQYLDETVDNYVNIHLTFLVQLSAHLGFQPHEETYTDGSIFDLKEGVFTRETVGHVHFLDAHLSKILRGVIIADWQNTTAVKMTRTERQQLLNALIDYYRLHIDNFPDINSLKILQELF